MTYSAPRNDTEFALELIGAEELTKLPGFENMSINSILSDLDGSSGVVNKFGALYQSGDREGATFENGVVRMPKGSKEAYQAFVDGGWNAISVNEKNGGSGMPWVVGMAFQERLQSANLPLALFTLLNQGAMEMLAECGSDQLKKMFLPDMVSGKSTCTMNLTESQAGSDVGAIRCQAVKKDDHYLITGQKIFISYGDNDMADNVIHMVLARLPGAPEGAKGLSLFLVPKFMMKNDGTLGDRNDVRVVSIERKMGLHASPTCVMSYGDNGGAFGYLIGKEGGGMTAMFKMMNNARISVGYQGLAIMEAAYQQAVHFAKERQQGGRPIIKYPDVRRMLLEMKSSIEAARALAYSCAYTVDISKHAADAAQREQAAARADWMTPIVKSWITDLSVKMTSLAMQVYGGMGYIEEIGIAQYARDARILPTYEGTNGIQAIDLAFRKTRDEKRKGISTPGASLNELLGEMEGFLPELAKQPGEDFAAMHRHFSSSLQHMRLAGEWIVKREDPNFVLASAVPFLNLAGNTFGGYFMAKSAILARKKLASQTDRQNFLNAKIVAADHYATHVLPQCPGLATTVMEGARATLAMTPEMFIIG